MKEDFLLNRELAKRLYKKVRDIPVIDYHNHLSVREIKENKRFENLYELWIGPDPYKHRAMRMCGVPEKYITGEGTKEEKFAAWCTIFPRLAGNPLYQWSLMELEDVLEIRDIPGKDNWNMIWQRSREYMERNEISAGSILKKYRVEYASPCGSLTDDLSVFKRQEGIAPSLRGDSIINPDQDFIRELERLTGKTVTGLNDFFQAVKKRLDEFQAVGCIFADHSLDDGFRYRKEDGQSGFRFEKLLKNEPVSREDQEILSSEILRFLSSEYAGRGMILQLHMGARRFTSTRLRKCAGGAGGYAAIGNSVDMASLTELLDQIEQTEKGLPKTILYTLNPADHGMVSALAGSYSKDGEAGLVTQGPAWWWCDHSLGIRSLLDNTAVFGLLSNFVGMTTDSRSFLSFIRHDYFRRILCDWMAEQVSDQRLPSDIRLLENLVYDMCYGNAKKIIKKKERV